MYLIAEDEIFLCLLLQAGLREAHSKKGSVTIAVFTGGDHRGKSLPCERRGEEVRVNLLTMQRGETCAGQLRISGGRMDYDGQLDVSI